MTTINFSSLVLTNVYRSSSAEIRQAVTYAPDFYLICSHPHPAISPIVLPKPLRGAALVSPWGDFSHSSDAYKNNRNKDSWNGPVLAECARIFLGDAKPDEWNQPFRASGSWWTDLATKVEDILITGGADEVMVDDIRRFATTVTVSIVKFPGLNVANIILLGAPYKHRYFNRGWRSP